MRVRRAVAIPVVAVLGLGVTLTKSSAETVPESPVGWTNSFGSPGDESGGLIYGVSMARSPSGDIYVAGTTTGTFPGQPFANLDDMFIARFDKSGNRKWIREFGSTDNDYLYGLAVSSSGDAYAVGTTYGDLDGVSGPGPLGEADVFVTRFDKNGNQKWVRQFGTAIEDRARAVAISGSDIYIGGLTRGGIDGGGPALGSDAFVTRYDKNGNQKWVRQFGTVDDDLVSGLAMRGSSEIYATGQTEGDMGNQQGNIDGFVTRFDKGGNRLWTQQFGSAGSDEPFSIAVAGTTDVYVAGTTNGPLGPPGPQGEEDGFVTRYDKNGNSVWTRQFGTDGYDDARSVAVSSAGAVYVVGYTDGDIDGDGPQPPIGDGDMYLMRMDKNNSGSSFRQFGTPWFEAWPRVVLTSSGLPIVAGLTAGVMFGHTNFGDIDVFLTQFPAS